MALINFRTIANKTGYDFNSGSTTWIFAEDFLTFKSALQNPHETGSEVFFQAYNVTTTQRDAISIPTGSEGFIVFNTTNNRPEIYVNGSWTTFSAAINVNDINDVTITSVAGSEILRYDSDAGSWINNTLAEAGISAIGHTHIAGSITDFGSAVQANGSVVLNTTHRTSDGTDHTYINQDVTTTASPVFANGSYTGSVLVSQLNSSGSVTGVVGSFSAIYGEIQDTTFTNISVSGSVVVTGLVSASSFSGSLNAGSIFAGTLNESRLPTNIAVSGSLTAGSLNSTGNINATGSVIGAVGSFGTLYGEVQDTTFTNLSLSGSLEVTGSVKGTAGSFTSTITALDFNGSLDAGSVFTGTLSDDRLPTSQAGKTFTSDSVFTNGSFSGSFSVQEIRFDTAFTPGAHSEGRLNWNSDDKTLELDTDVTDVSLQIGQEMYIRGVNKTGSTILNGAAVYLGPAQGNRPTLLLAKANDATTASAVGLVTEDILDNAEGYVSTFGLIRGVDTSAWAVGSQLYLSATVAGSLTDTAPGSPNFNLAIAKPISSTSNGTLLAAPGPTDVVGSMVIQHIDTLNGVTASKMTSYGSVIGDVGSFNKIYGDIQDTTYTNLAVSGSVEITGSLKGSVGSFTSTVTALDFNGSLDAGSVFTGTLNDNRLPSTQTGKTFSSDVSGTNVGLTGSLTAGSVNSTGNMNATGSIIAAVGSFGTLYGEVQDTTFSNLSLSGSLELTGSLKGSVGSFTSTVTALDFNGSLDAGSLFTGTLADARVAESNVTQHQAAIDHGALAGILDDDHTQYLLVNGTRTGSNLIVSGSVVATNFSGSLNAGSIFAGTLDESRLPTNVAISGSLAAGSLNSSGNINATGSVIGAVGSFGTLYGEVQDTTFTNLSLSGSLEMTGSIKGSVGSFTSTVTALDFNGSLNAGSLFAGTVADARISESSVTQQEAAIDHDALTNFVANEHIDWTSATQTVNTSGSVVAAYGSFSKNVGSFFGDGANINNIDHGGLVGLGDDDHTQYLLVDGTRTGSNLVLAGSVVSVNGSMTGSLTAGSVVSSGNIEATGNYYGSAGNMTLARIGASTYSNVQHLQDVFHSAGWTSGGAVTLNAGSLVDVAAGTGLIRTSASDVAELNYFDWSGSTGILVESGSTIYFGVEYNAGTPRISKRTSRTWNWQTDFEIGTVVNEGNGSLHIVSNPDAVGDHAINMVNRLYDTLRIVRSTVDGGLILNETGTRNIVVSVGALWHKLTKFSISAVDTSATGSFDAYYRDGAGGWTGSYGYTQWPNTEYDNNSGGVVEMTANRYGVHWFYMDLDGGLSMVYSQSEYATLAAAQDATTPSTLPARLQAESILLGRLIYQKSDATATDIETAFSTVFEGTGVTDHGALAGLTDDDHTQYVLSAGTRAMTYLTVNGSVSATSGSFNGSLVTGSVIASYGSYTDKVVAGSFIGDASQITSAPLTTTLTFAGSALGGRDGNDENGSYVHSSNLPSYSMVFVEGLLRGAADYSISTDTITFPIPIFDSDEVIMRI